MMTRCHQMSLRSTALFVGYISIPSTVIFIYVAITNSLPASTKTIPTQTKLLECFSCGNYPGWRPSLLNQALRISRNALTDSTLSGPGPNQNGSTGLLIVCDVPSIGMLKSRLRRDVSNYPTLDTTACVGYCAKVQYKDNEDQWRLAKNCLPQCEETEDDEVKMYCCGNKDKCNDAWILDYGQKMTSYTFILVALHWMLTRIYIS